ncbi:hypothetical protein GEMRC1_001280 [Eukaryota sp. GEM-RC1]
MPQILVTDRDLALCNAIEQYCPRAKHIRCLWHIFKNVESKAMKSFGHSEELEEFNRLFTQLAYSVSTNDFELALSQIEEFLGAEHRLFRWYAK